jgi:hypothetical protein
LHRAQNPDSVFTGTLEVLQATVRNLELGAVNSEAPTGTVPAIAQLPGIGTVAPSPAAGPGEFIPRVI